MYVPMFKTKKQELSVSKEMNHCFSSETIPLYEILTDKYKVRYKTDPKTNLEIREKKGKRMMRVKETPSNDDIITLDFINNIVDNKKAFIDFFRFTIEKYGKRINVSSAELALKLSRDPESYKRRVKEVMRYDNLIPTISIKQGFEFGKNELQDFLEDLQKQKESIALRITENYLENYGLIIKNQLRETDYLLFDIGEQNPSSKVMEFEELQEMKLRANIIVLNSPRKADLNNGEYIGTGITDLIDNSLRDVLREYGFKGFGDYAGLKDNLSSKGGGRRGAALALLYDYEKNGFYSFLNPDTMQGAGGYLKVRDEILAGKAFLDPMGNCPAIQKVQNLENSGNWGTWINILVTRYIHQMCK